MSKYYTPTIDEFYVGFEYEMVIPVGFTYIDFSNPDEKPEITWSDKYSKGVFQVKPADPFGGELASIAAAIKINKCRVKYLDTEDVESLGFVKDSGNKDFIKEEFQLEIIEDVVFISRKYGEILLFQGTIKNKSELKRILKQLSV